MAALLQKTIRQFDDKSLLGRAERQFFFPEKRDSVRGRRMGDIDSAEFPRFQPPRPPAPPPRHPVDAGRETNEAIRILCARPRRRCKPILRRLFFGENNVCPKDRIRQ
jgi:hypothetical protein